MRALRATRGDRAGGGSGQCESEQHDGCGAGKAGRAVEGLQQHHRVGPRQEASDEIGKLELTDRERGHRDQAGGETVPQRRQNHIAEARNEARAKQLYERAAQQNYPASMFNLADMLRSGAEAERTRAIALYSQLACMPDERQIQPMAVARLRALRQSAACR